jgi:antitoxin (DNA-binding transcriptional repressor) of toxin-antitoxin stability system
MIEAGVEEIQRDLSAFLQRIQAGEIVVILHAGHPVAEVKAIVIPIATFRPYALCAGEFTVPEKFDAPLPEDLLTPLRVHEASTTAGCQAGAWEPAKPRFERRCRISSATIG